MTPRILAAVAILTAGLALVRFGNTTPDSRYYIAMAEYFKGALGRAELQTPFAFRWVMPWLASHVPGADGASALAGCALLATVLACLCVGRLLVRLMATQAQVHAGLLVLILSFPTLNYGAAVLTDSAGFLVLAAASLALVERRHVLLVLLLVIGVWVRETTILMLPVCWVYAGLERDRRSVLAAAAVTVLAPAAALLARWWFAELPPYFWMPDWGRFMANMTRPLSWATVLLALCPVAVFATAGLTQWPAMPPRARHFVLATAPPCLGLLAYSVVAAFMSGRFCWPLYLALVPLAAAGHPVWDRYRWAERLGRLVFGAPPAATAEP